MPVDCYELVWFYSAISFLLGIFSYCLAFFVTDMAAERRRQQLSETTVVDGVPAHGRVLQGDDE